MDSVFGDFEFRVRELEFGVIVLPSYKQHAGDLGKPVVGSFLKGYLYNEIKGIGLQGCKYGFKVWRPGR